MVRAANCCERNNNKEERDKRGQLYNTKADTALKNNSLTLN